MSSGTVAANVRELAVPLSKDLIRNKIDQAKGVPHDSTLGPAHILVETAADWNRRYGQSRANSSKGTALIDRATLEPLFDFVAELLHGRKHPDDLLLA